MTWLKDTVERVIRTFLQAWLGSWVAVAGALDLADVDSKLNGPLWNLFAEAYLFAGFLAAVIAFLTCLAAKQTSGPGASLTKAA